MANIAAKKIERLVNKEGLQVNGYYIIEGIEIDYLEEAKRLGMAAGITEGYEFQSEFTFDGGVSLKFYGEMVEDYRHISPDQEVPFYYPHLETCVIKKEGQKEIVLDLDVYWGK